MTAREAQTRAHVGNEAQPSCPRSRSPGAGLGTCPLLILSGLPPGTGRPLPAVPAGLAFRPPKLTARGHATAGASVSWVLLAFLPERGPERHGQCSSFDAGRSADPSLSSRRPQGHLAGAEDWTACPAKIPLRETPAGRRMAATGTGLPRPEGRPPSGPTFAPGPLAGSAGCAHDQRGLAKGSHGPESLSPRLTCSEFRVSRGRA